jgi:hypothetical protein
LFARRLCFQGAQRPGYSRLDLTGIICIFAERGIRRVKRIDRRLEGEGSLRIIWIIRWSAYDTPQRKCTYRECQQQRHDSQ